MASILRRPSARREWGLAVVVAAAVAGMGLVAGGARGGALTWGGGPGPCDGNWDTLANWGNNPTTSADDLLFDVTGSVNSVITLGSETARSLTFADALYTFQGGSLNLWGAINANYDAIISSPLSLGASSTWTVAGGRMLTVNNANLEANGNAIIVGGAGNTTVSAAVHSAAGLTKNDGGTLALSGGGSFTSTTINGGALRVGNVGALGAAGAALALNGGTLDLATDTTVNACNTTVGGTSTIQSDRASSGAGVTHALGTLSIGAYQLSIAKGASVGSGTAGVTFTGTTLTGNAVFDVAASANLTLGAVGGSFSLTKQGAGTLTLNTTSTRNNPAATTTLTAGMLRLGTPNALETSQQAFALNGGTLSVGVDGGATINGTNMTVGGTATIQIDRYTVGAGVTDTFGTLSIGTQQLNLTMGANVSTGTPGATFLGTTLTGNPTFSPSASTLLTLGALGDGGTARSIIKQNSGTLVLAAAATSYTGTFDIRAGTLSTSADLQTGTGTGNVILLSNNAVFRATTSYTLAAGKSINLGTGGGTINVGAVTLTLGAAGQLTGAGALTVAGTTGTLALGGANTGFSGITTIGGGTLRVGVNNALANTTRLTIGSTGNNCTLDLYSHNQQIAGLATAGTAANQTITSGVAGSAILSVNNDAGTSNADFTFGGVIENGAGGAGVVGLTKMGSRNLTLSAANSYTGPTTISGGSLILAGTGSIAGSSSIAIGGGATYDVSAVSNYALTAQVLAAKGTGTASVSGAVNAGGNTIDMQDGVSIGTLAFSGALSMNGAGLKFDIGSGSTDQITLGGRATVAGSNTISVAALPGLGALASGDYTLISAPSGGLDAPGVFTLSSTTIAIGGANYGFSLAHSTPTAEVLTIVVLPPAGSGEWIDGSGDHKWTTNVATNDKNWRTAYPSGAGQIATFGAAGGGGVVYLNGDKTVGGLTFGAAGSDYTISGDTVPAQSIVAGTLKIQGAAAAITVNAGSPTISAPTVIASATSINIDPSAKLTIGALTINQGVKATLNSSGKALLLAGGNPRADLSGIPGQLDLRTTALVVRGPGTDIGEPSGSGGYTGLSGAIAARALTCSTTADAAGNHGLAIMTAAQAIANGHAADAGESFSFHGETVSGADLLVQYGYNGDVNMDDRIDYLDYGVIDNGYLWNQDPGHAGSQRYGYAAGDVNLDGTINYLDYGMMDNAYLAQAAPHSAAVSSASLATENSAVPEPAALGLLGFAAIGLMRERRRRREGRP